MSRLQSTGHLLSVVQQYLASCRIVSIVVCCPFCMRSARPPAAYPRSSAKAEEVCRARQHCSAAFLCPSARPWPRALLMPARRLR